jgi:hypothetical protein
VLYLIGIDHSVQHDGCSAYHGAEFENLRREFPEFLAQTVRETGAKMIAEECNEEVLLKFAATRSVAAVVASEMNLSHLFCEPSLAERAKLGITGTGNPSDFEKREEYWLKQLRAVDKTPIIFIMGADHVHSFLGLAKTFGIGVEIVDDYYGRDYFAP